MSEPTISAARVLEVLRADNTDAAKLAELWRLADDARRYSQTVDTGHNFYTPPPTYYDPRD